MRVKTEGHQKTNVAYLRSSAVCRLVDRFAVDQKQFYTFRDA